MRIYISVPLKIVEAKSLAGSKTRLHVYMDETWNSRTLEFEANKQLGNCKSSSVETCFHCQEEGF